MLYRLMLWGSRIAVLLLALSFIVPFLAPERFPNLSMASLAVSPLIFLNIIFLIYWFLKRWKKGILTALVLFIAYLHFGPFIEFSSEGDTKEYRETLSLSSYNVRLFNAYEKEVDTAEVSEVLSTMIATQQPDVIAVQEYYNPNSVDFSSYPYSFIHFKKGNKLGHAVFSKFPIVNKGAFDFNKSYNNSIYVDIAKGSDTIRVYNLHLQSIGILPDVGYLQDGDTERIRLRMARNFKKQQGQVEEILKHKATSPYPVLMAGDFNNTAFSYIYRKLTKDMTDAFLVRGNGIGSTFKFDFYPMRIDYIMASENSFDVINFETLETSFSDHKPVFATLGWPRRTE
ncbi:endonuclease/exonuclease/phosphatase family protein [Aureitalea sp. L0-47]|uniref:endonuclease/exonuclease/phosphatase family protein n=1 Tax=Aureitalea sp. L0-47 TaxID=2816962 RepID=UPI002238823B|nr:endonuclease/exonuclease/phosphatase family protein [Aureitalea sp. L0-47]MCW5521001.1 endonuclease/exonuclease/phosphatase family protein [Aureitalea sp. L0-47]